MQILARGLQNRADDADGRTQRHADLPAVRIGAGAGDERAGDVPDDIQRSDQALVVGVDAEIVGEGGDGREAACMLILAVARFARNDITHRKC